MKTARRVSAILVEIGDRVVKVKFVVPWLVIFSLGLGVVYLRIAEGNQRDLETLRAQQVASCLSRVEGREDSRRQWIAFFDALESVYESLGSEGAVLIINERLRPTLDENLPSLNREECLLNEPIGED